MHPGRLCTEYVCNNPELARGLCRKHYDRHRAQGRQGRRTRTQSGNTRAGGPLVIICPDDLIPLVGQCAENDARAIFRVLWKTIGEWHLQGLLEDAS